MRKGSLRDFFVRFGYAGNEVREMAIGKNIKKLRTARGLTQDQLAEKLYVTRQTISNWERGTSRPDLDQLEAIAGALGADVTSLLYGDRPPVPPPGGKRIALAVLLLAAGAAMWLLGAYRVGPFVHDYVGSTYQYRWYPVYRFGYQGITAFLLGSGLLAALALRWDLSLGRRGRTAAWIVALSGIGFLLFTTVSSCSLTGQGEVGRVGNLLLLYLIRTEVRLPVSFLTGAALFLALNPARKRT